MWQKSFIATRSLTSQIHGCLNTQILVMSGSHPLTTGILRRQIPPVSGTTWCSNAQCIQAHASTTADPSACGIVSLCRPVCDNLIWIELLQSITIHSYTYTRDQNHTFSRIISNFVFILHPTIGQTDYHVINAHSLFHRLILSTWQYILSSGFLLMSGMEWYLVIVDRT